MPAAVALVVAVACFLGAAFLYGRRDGVLRFMVRWHGYPFRPPGPRRRYLRGVAGQLDMLSPTGCLIAVATIFLCYALVAVR